MKKREQLSDFLMITAGTIICAAAVYFFLLPSHITVGSISGLALIISNFVPLPISAITMVLNVGLLIVGFLLIGRDFGAKTVYTSILVPAVLWVLELLFPDNQSIMEDPFLDMFCFLFIVSIGQTMLFVKNASSGGLDVVAKLLNKFFRMELGKAVSVAGMCVALSSAFLYDAKTVMLSVLGTYLNGIVLDHFIFGFDQKRRVCIMSSKLDELRDFIINELHSGATIYESIGAYDNAPRREIIVIVNKAEYSRLMTHVEKTDPKAFITVYAVSAVSYQPKPRDAK